MSDLVLRPAFWGFLGALVYASLVLVATVWGAENPLSARERNLALARFVIAITFGPIAAEGFSGTLLNMWLTGKADLRAISLGIGLSANWLYPIIVRAWGRKVQRDLGDKPS